MNPSKAGYTLTQDEEGLVLHPYLDQAKVPTIGYGTTRYPDGRHVTMQDASITEDQALTYLESAMTQAAEDVTAMTAGVGINQNQFDALVDFAYNAGSAALHGSTLLHLIMANTIDPNITAAFLMWDKIHVDGQLKVCDALVKRRKREALLYFS